MCASSTCAPQLSQTGMQRPPDKAARMAWSRIAGKRRGSSAEEIFSGNLEGVYGFELDAIASEVFRAVKGCVSLLHQATEFGCFLARKPGGAKAGRPTHRRAIPFELFSRKLFANAVHHDLHIAFVRM